MFPCFFKATPKALLLLCLFGMSSLVAQSNSVQITATDYCECLNAIAKTDLHHLYDEKMGADPETACILRSGAPGSFYYNVIAGRENIPMTYLSTENAIYYCHWQESRLQATGYRLQEDVEETLSAVSDFSLASNQHLFWIVEPKALQESLTSGTASSDNENSSWEKEALIGVGIVAAAAGGYGLYRWFSAPEEMRPLEDENLARFHLNLENSFIFEDEGPQERLIPNERHHLILKPLKKISDHSLMRVVDNFLVPLVAKGQALLRDHYRNDIDEIQDRTIKILSTRLNNTVVRYADCITQFIEQQNKTKADPSLLLSGVMNAWERMPEIERAIRSVKTLLENYTANQAVRILDQIPQNNGIWLHLFTNFSAAASAKISSLDTRLDGRFDAVRQYDEAVAYHVRATTLLQEACDEHDIGRRNQLVANAINTEKSGAKKSRLAGIDRRKKIFLSGSKELAEAEKNEIRYQEFSGLVERQEEYQLDQPESNLLQQATQLLQVVAQSSGIVVPEESTKLLIKKNSRRAISQAIISEMQSIAFLGNRDGFSKETAEKLSYHYARLADEATRIVHYGDHALEAYDERKSTVAFAYQRAQNSAIKACNAGQRVVDALKAEAQNPAAWEYHHWQFRRSYNDRAYYNLKAQVQATFAPAAGFLGFEKGGAKGILVGSLIALTLKLLILYHHYG